ncbi:alpha-tocopherol transfer protein-like [Thrips palmi]|uniref:Alpha-tocopherol transfer protein-like n=1 Tax=Thrips palmi TaxID=161013 RepID=A0A6P8YNN1_THRPL|nr:alpha-tocopherol transfer protein-like [Thrips palmi]
MKNQRLLENKVKAMQHPTEEEASRILAAYGITKAGLARDVANIRAWLEKQPHLPADDIDDVVIERLLVRCKNSVVMAQCRLDDMYTVRSDLPEFYTDRDPLAPRLQQLFRVVGLCVMPRLTSDLHRVSLIRLRDTAVENFSVELLIKLTFMGQDVVIREPPTMGDCLIFDARGYELAHASGASPLFIRKAVSHVRRTYPARVAGIHVLFPPVFAGRIINIVKSFLPDKIASRIYTHDSFDSLLEHVPQDVLPSDYGGQERSSDELCELWQEKLVSYREYFLSTEKVRSNEVLRQEKRKDNSISSSLDGSFRKLDID